MLEDGFVHIHPVTRGTKVVELRKERAPGRECTASPLLIHQGGSSPEGRQKENPRTPHARAQHRVRRELAGEIPGLCWVGNSLRLPVTRRAPVAAPMAHSTPCPAGTGTRLSLTWLPPMSGHLTPAERPSLSQEAWPFILPPMGLRLLSSSPTSLRILTPSPPAPRADSLPVPRGQRLEWHLKSAPEFRAPQGAGRKGWRQSMAPEAAGPKSQQRGVRGSPGSFSLR